MKREILALCSGEFLKTDVSYRVAGKTKTTSGVKGLCCVLGEDGKSQRYGAVTSESEKQVYPLFLRCVTVRR